MNKISAGKIVLAIGLFAFVLTGFAPAFRHSVFRYFDPIRTPASLMIPCLSFIIALFVWRGKKWAWLVVILICSIYGMFSLYKGYIYDRGLDYVTSQQSEYRTWAWGYLYASISLIYPSVRKHLSAKWKKTDI